MTTAVADYTLHDFERARVAASFEVFLEHVKILEPPPGGGKIDFVMWDHLKEVAILLATERLLSFGKARQLGLTWILAAYSDWKAMYHEGAVVLLFSQGQAEAGVFLSKCKFIYNELPEHLKVSLGTDSSIAMTFPSMNSKITALPSTLNAGRSETATVVIEDEAAFHEHLDANYAAVKPTIDAGGQLIQVSTINKKNLGSLFAQIFRDAWYGKGKNGFKAAFYGPFCRPGRDDAWYRRMRAEAPDTSEMSAEFFVSQEYPRTVEEMLAPSRVLSAFDPEALAAMLEDVKKPVETHGPINIYQKHSVGKRYSAGSDVSHGVGQDSSVTTILDVGTGTIVADIHSNVISPEEFAERSVKLMEMYDNPIWAIERNEWGILAVRKAQELGYPRLYEPKNKGGKPTGRVGWDTNALTRPLMWGELIDAVKQRLINILSARGLEEFSAVIRNPDKEGRIEAMRGANDDYPTSAAIAFQMRHHAYGGRPRKIKSKKFGKRVREIMSIRA
jgi:hypothetical protein